MVTIEQLQSWRPSALSHVADALQRRKRSVEALQDAIDASRPPKDWEDQYGSEAALQMWHELRDELNDIAAEISRAMGEFDVAATHLTSAKDALHDWMETARKHRFNVSESGGSITVTPPEGAEDDGGPTPAEVSQGISSVLEKARQADADLAAGLSAATKGKVDGGSGSIRGAESKGLGSAMTVPEQIEYAKHHKIPADEIGMISPAAQTALAGDVAADIGSDGADGVTPETARIMANLHAGQPFTHELFSRVPPHSFAAALEDLNKDAYPNPADSSDPGERKLYKDFLNAAGADLATYSNATGQYAPAGGPHGLADQWFKAITDSEHKQDASALTLMVKAGGHQAAYNRGFVGDLTDQVYRWEQDQDGAVWKPRDGEEMWDPNDPPKLHTSYDRDGMPIHSWEGGVRGSDGLANLMGGMEHSPDAAKDFFMGRHPGDPGSTEEMHRRMDYFIGGEDGRTWDFADGSDDGDGLGKALQAACVGDDARTPEGTEITNKLFENVAKYGGEADGKFSDSWHVGPNMTDSLGTIASGYSGDIYDAMNNTPFAHGPTHLNIGTHTLTDVLGEIGASDDKNGLQTLTTSMMLECRNKNIELLHNLHGPHTIDALNGSGYLGQQQQNGNVMGNLMHYGTSLWDDNDNIDDQRHAMMAKAIDISANFVPGAGSVLGEGASDLAKTTYDTVKGEALSHISDAVASGGPTRACDYTSSMANSLPDMLQANSVSDLYREGYLGPQDLKQSGHFEGASPHLFVGDPPTLRKEYSTIAGGGDGPYSDDWRRFKNSPAFDLIMQNTHNQDFIEKLERPSPVGDA